MGTNSLFTFAPVSKKGRLDSSWWHHVRDTKSHVTKRFRQRISENWKKGNITKWNRHPYVCQRWRNLNKISWIHEKAKKVLETLDLSEASCTTRPPGPPCTKNGSRAAISRHDSNFVYLNFRVRMTAFCSLVYWENPINSGVLFGSVLGKEFCFRKICHILRFLRFVESNVYLSRVCHI